MNSKLNAWIIASRTRQSLNCSRRVFITKPVMPVGRLCGISDLTIVARLHRREVELRVPFLRVRLAHGR